MIFTETELKGAFVIEMERREDERGFFARAFSQDDFDAHGLNPRVSQCNIALSRRKGILRGLHYQTAPYAEAKLVRCTRGAIFDVMVDLRRESPSALQWFGVELTEHNRKMLYVPEGFAHGYQALADNAEVFYQVSEPYHPECERGARWNDPAFGIQWPLPDPILSAKDQAFPDYKP